jgi:hypothetical protein
MINIVRNNNQTLKIQSIHDSSFLKYGRVLDKELFEDAFNYLKTVDIPKEGNRYLAHDDEFFQTIKNPFSYNELFGYVSLEYGHVSGQNQHLDSLEYHKSSEINICITPLVLFLGHKSDIENNMYDSSKCEVFYVPENTVIELDPLVLHFSPCKVLESGFICGVVLPKGTNEEIVLERNNPSKDPLLFKKNKWLITHVENTNRIKQGAFPGLCGINYKINL